MAKDKKPNFPGVPEFQSSPNVEGDIDLLSKVGRGLTSGDFMNADDPQLGFLNDLVKLNPEATKQAVGLASRDVVELRDKAQQDILNQLEANNQLTSSTSVNRLSDLNEAFSSDIADISTNFYLADVERTLSNVGNLFQLGLGSTEASASLGLNQQAQVNSFNMQKFDYEVALEAERFSRQQAKTAALGKLAGFYLPPGIGTAVGGALGGSVGASSAHAGNMDQINLGLQALSAYKGGGAQNVGGTNNSIGASSYAQNGSAGGGGGLASNSMFGNQGLSYNNLTQRELVSASRINQGFGFGSAGGTA